MMVKVIHSTGEPKSIGNPLGTIPAACALDEERRDLRKNHACPVIAVALGVVEKDFNSFYLLLGYGYTDHVVVFSVLCLFKPYLPHAGCPEGLDAYGVAVRHDQFCMRIEGLGSGPDKSVVPVSCALIERYAKLKWFVRLYPMVL
jgi:hypothetical protein